MRILYSSNGFFVPSGYGVQGRSLLPRLAALPEVGGAENVAMFAWYGLQGGVASLAGIRCYPAGLDPYGNDVIGAHVKDFAADVVVTLIDAWVLRDTAKKVAPAKWLPWLPIDSDPVPVKVLEALEGAWLPLTYSKWGSERLAQAGVANRYIPHGVEPGVFRVLDEGVVRKFRREVMGDPSHLTVMVAANKGYPDRKGFQQQLRGWQEFAQDKPSAKLYVHTEPTTVYGGLELGALVENLGLTGKVMFPDRYQYFKGLPQEFMALLYNAADVYLGATMAEGFGLPLIEAQACGTPVVTTEFSAMTELTRWGIAVPPLDMLWTPLNTWQAWPDWRGIAEALEALYAEWVVNRGWDGAWREVVAAGVHAEYGWDVIVREHWAPLFAELAEELWGGVHAA